MKILFFDAVNDWIIVGVYIIKDKELKELSIYKGFHPRESSFRLITDISLVLKKAGIKIPDRIVTSIGPGSFTGVRITVGTARNLSQIWKIPAIGIDTIEYYSAAYYSIVKQPVILMMDGRQKKVYTGYFNGTFKGSYDIRPEEWEKYFTEKERMSILYTNSSLVNKGEPLMAEIPDPLPILKIKLQEIINATTEKNNYKTLLPNYMRASYAEQ